MKNAPKATKARLETTSDECFNNFKSIKGWETDFNQKTTEASKITAKINEPATNKVCSLM